ncbi:lipoprotein [Clostridium sediminicola]|uniref:hypothetical protein n=1 Tax=Clostridium sediminicola TaxID=3114879 RepID=UPI0031F27669
MKHFKFITLFTTIIFSLIILTSCSTSKISYTAEISAPEKTNVPIFGTWIVEKYILPTGFSDSNIKVDTQIGNKFIFDADKAVVNENIYYNLDYKIKSISTEDYFLNNFKTNPSTLNINDSTINVITLSSDDSFLDNYVLLEDESLVTSKNGIFYFLKRIDSSEESDNIDLIPKEGEIQEKDEVNDKTEMHSDDNSSVNEKSENIYSDIIESGMLLCLKSYKPKDYNIPYSLTDSVTEPSYRTLWISYNGKYVCEVNEVPYILLPRKTGFWRIDTDRIVEKKYVKDYLYAYPIQSQVSKSKDDDIIPENAEFNDLIDINFIGNDYLSLNMNSAIFFKESDQSYSYQLMRVVPIDTINGINITPIPITEILGEPGKQALKDGAISFLNSADEETKKSLETTPEYLSFGVVRDVGKWIIKGRLNYVNEASRGNYADFTIPIIPSKDLVAHDNLYPSWNLIKEKVPEAVDAYSSPLENFIIVLTSKNILTYSVENGVIASEPLIDFPLQKDEIPIMSQWATGNYVNSWTKAATTKEK